MNQQYKQFGFNPDSAKQADSSLRIEEAGKYVGVIKHMEFITAKSGTTGFEIEFETDNKESASFSIWTEKKTVLHWVEFTKLMLCSLVLVLAV